MLYFHKLCFGYLDLQGFHKLKVQIADYLCFMTQRNLGVAQMDVLIKECQSLNLSKYLSEVATAIVEAKIKFTDIPPAVLLCTELNSTYAEFTGFLQEQFIKVLSINKDEPVSSIYICIYFYFAKFLISLWMDQ